MQTEEGFLIAQRLKVDFISGFSEEDLNLNPFSLQS